MAQKETPAARRRWWQTLALVTGMVAALGGVAAPVNADVTLRGFDSISTVNKDNLWFHMATIGDRYVIFTDRGIVEGPASIQQKWPFLPERFTHDLDAIGVAFGGQRFLWRYTFVKGNELVTFTDQSTGVTPQTQVQTYDGISSYNRNIGFSDFNYVAVEGGNFATSAQLPLPATTTPLSTIPGLPERFHNDLDEVSYELGTSGNLLGVLTLSFYKDNERVILQRGTVQELVRLDVKWPFLNPFRTVA